MKANQVLFGRAICAKAFPTPGFYRCSLLRLYLSSLLATAKDRKAFQGIDTYFMFVGYARSGHSLVGSIIDAHANAICSHEVDVLQFVEAGFGKSQIFSLILNNSRHFAAHNRVWEHGYSYAIPGQWQGRFSTLRVIGDKKGGGSTRRLAGDISLFEKLKRTVKMPTRIVHVVRNPFDNISTISIRSRIDIREAIQGYFSHAEANARLQRLVPEHDWINIEHEDLVARPAHVIAELIRRLGLDTTPEFVEACAAIVRNEPHKSRSTIDWRPDLLQQVESRKNSLSFLRQYRYER